MEELCSGIRILNNVQKLVLVVLQDPWAPVVVPQYIHFLWVCMVSVLVSGFYFIVFGISIRNTHFFSQHKRSRATIY
jgi:hypothetical protein